MNMVFCINLGNVIICHPDYAFIFYLIFLYLDWVSFESNTCIPGFNRELKANKLIWYALMCVSRSLPGLLKIV